MKKLILLILLLAMAAANATAARMYPAGGRVVDAQGQAVEYATVVLLRGGEQVAGMATDDAGRFELKVPTGEYTLSIQYLGFDPVLRQVRVDADNDLGDIVLNLFRAREQAEEYGHSVTREMGYLTAHAIFHLMGYDHMEEEDKRTMRAMEKRAMRRLGLYKEEERDMTDMEMKALAIDALKLSYVPYSKYHVGACLLAVDGRTFQGANFENASYGATICAERCAVSNAIAHGVHRFTAIFIATEHDLAWPCGICRQVLNEFKAGDMRVVIGNTDGKWVEKNLSQLLPESFGPENLGLSEE